MTTPSRSPATSRNPDVLAAFQDAEARIKRRDRGAFSSVKAAIGWWGEARQRMQAANGMHPRTELVNAATGERARIAVDGGRGGDLDGTLATIATIGEALEAAQVAEPMGTTALVEWITTGKSQQSIADRQRVPQRTLSDHIGRAERVIQRKLAAAGLL